MSVQQQQPSKQFKKHSNMFIILIGCLTCSLSCLFEFNDEKSELCLWLELSTLLMNAITYPKWADNCNQLRNYYRTWILNQYESKNNVYGFSEDAFNVLLSFLTIIYNLLIKHKYDKINQR